MINYLKQLTTICVLMATIAYTAPLKQSAWNSLPANTVGAIHANLGAKSLKELNDNTKWGEIINSRKKKFSEIIKKHFDKYTNEEPNGKEFKKEWDKLNIKITDLFKLFANDCGIAMMKTEGDLNNSIITALIWLEPKADIASKLYDGGLKMITDGLLKEKNIKRRDFTIAGAKASLFDIKEEHTAIILTRINNRIMITIAGTDATNIEQENIIKVTKNNFGRFITAQKNGRAGGFVKKMTSIPGVKKSYDRGEAIIEILGDLKPIIKLIPKNNMDIDYAKLLGLNTLGAVSVRYVVDKNKLKMSLFAEANAPKEGILGVLEQPTMKISVPSWIPESAVSYSKASFDSIESYKRIKKIIIRAMGEPLVDQYLAMINMQLQQTMQLNLEQLLAKLGKNVDILNLGISNVKMAELEVPQQKMALVIDIKQDLVDKLCNLITQLGANAPMLQQDDQLTFKGWKLVQGETTFACISYYFGKGKLVVCLGKDTAKQVLSALVNPPKGAAALVNSRKYQKIKASSPFFNKAMLFSYIDNDRSMQKAVKQLSTTINMIGKMGMDKEFLLILKELMTLVPSTQEVKGTMGSAFMAIKATNEGFEAHSVAELPYK